MMEAARTSETSVNFQITRRYNPEADIFWLTAVRTSNLLSFAEVYGTFQPLLKLDNNNGHSS
jgi:hypothetical protein